MNEKTKQKPIHVVAVPIDLGASRRGTDAGPSALRIAGLRRALEDIDQIVDGETDIAVPVMEARHSSDDSARYKSEILTVCQQLAQTNFDLLKKGLTPLVIGGDHSLAMGSISGVAAHFARSHSDIGVIWVDAHADMNVPGSSPSGNVHGMPLAHLLGYGDKDLSNVFDQHPAIKPENTVLIGIRDVDSNERKMVRESGLTVFTMRDIDERTMGTVCREALEIVNDGTAGFHVSFDVDGCDPSVIPGSGTLVPGGINFREAHQLLENCADTGRMTSMDVVELNPFLDHENISAKRTVALIQSAFGRSIL